MTEQEIVDNRIKMLNLKQKLEHHFRLFSSTPEITNNNFYLFLSDLKVKYKNDINSIEFIERITNNLHNLSSSNEYKVNFMRNICINNLNNEMLIRDLLEHIDMTTNYNFEDYKQHFINHNPTNITNDNEIKKMFEYNKEYFNSYTFKYTNDIEDINSKLDSIQKTTDEINSKISKNI
jgi:hypothetical protein